MNICLHIMINIFNCSHTHFSCLLLFPESSSDKCPQICSSSLRDIHMTTWDQIVINNSWYIYHSMNEGYEIQGAVLDISKAFDKVWHKGLVFKLKQNGISGNSLNILEIFLRTRKQWVILNGQTSTWKNIHAVVSEGSILWPLLLLIYINDISNPKFFADDTSLFSVVCDLNTYTNETGDDLKKIYMGKQVLSFFNLLSITSIRQDKWKRLVVFYGLLSNK